MSATDTTHAADDTEEVPGPKRLRPYQISILIGLGFGVITAISGVTATVFAFHDDSPVQREVFERHPEPAEARLLHRHPGAHHLRRACCSPTGCATGSGARPTTGRPPRRTPSAAWPGLPRRRLHADPAARPRRRHHALAHLLRFLILLAVTTVLEINHQVPESAEVPPRRRSTRRYSFVGDVAGLVFLIGVVWAIVRRYIQRPYRIRIKTKPEHAVILGTLLRSSASPASSPRCSASPLEGRPTSRSGRSSATRSSALVDGHRRTSPAGTRLWWIVHVPRFIVVPRDPAGHDAAPHVHVAAEHVPAATATAPRAP